MVKPAKASAQQQETDRRLDDATRKEITRLEALAQKTLKANPFSKEAEEAEEEKWRELAHARRQLRPLFEAWVKASEPNSESAQYKHGFLFRLVEAMATVAEVPEYERLHRLNQRRRGRQRKKTLQTGDTDAFDDLALECLSKLSSRTPAPFASDVWSAMISQIENDCADASLSVEKDGARIVLTGAGGRKRSVAKSSFPTIFSRLKKRDKPKPAPV